MRTRDEANRQRWAILGFAVAILVLSFLVLKSAYYQLVLTQVLLWAVLSLAWNLLSGYSGYFSFGHAAFWGLGAYTVALGMLYFDLTPWITIPFAAVVGAVAGALAGRGAAEAVNPTDPASRVSTPRAPTPPSPHASEHRRM